MKAKEYLKQICDNTYSTLLQDRINDVHLAMVDEMRNLESVRHIKRDEGKFSLLKEFDNKWKVIVRLAHGPSIDIDLHDNEFLLYVYRNVPEFKKFIQLEEPKYESDEDGDEKIPYFHNVIPLNEITDKNITREILACLYAIGAYINGGISLTSVTPLAYRISLLRYWKENGINYEQIDEFEKDPEKFARDIIKPIMQ